MPGRDFVDRDDDPTDPPGPHGTAVAGLAAARGGNGFGGVGACFSCRLMPLRVLGLDGFALNTNIAAAIDYAVDHGAAVVNISLYGPHSPPRLREAIVRARAAGVLVVAAAGPQGTPEPPDPAAVPETIGGGGAGTHERLDRGRLRHLRLRTARRRDRRPAASASSVCERGAARGRSREHRPAARRRAPRIRGRGRGTGVPRQPWAKPSARRLRATGDGADPGDLHGPLVRRRARRSLSLGALRGELRGDRRSDLTAICRFSG